MSGRKVLLALLFVVVSTVAIIWGWFTLAFELWRGHVPLWGMAISALLIADIASKVSERYFGNDIKSLAKRQHADESVRRVEAIPSKLQWTSGSRTQTLVDRDDVIAAIRGDGNG